MDSIPSILPWGNRLSIPAGHLPAGNGDYPDDMDLQAIRRKRLQQLVEEYGSQTALADKLGIEQNYISRALRGTKGIGEDFAARLESSTGKPSGWMSRLEKPEAEWPFEFDKKIWDTLPIETRHALEKAFESMIVGAQTVEATKTKKKKSMTG